MKTFKMISFDIVNEDSLQSFPLIDGIVINQENSHQSWIIELFMLKEYQAIFNDLLTSNKIFEARAVISFPDNEPAPFEVAVYAVKEIGDNISVLLKGTVKVKRRKYAEQLLEELIDEDLSREELLKRFEHGMKVRPKLKK